MNDPIELRRLLRAILSALPPGRRAGDELLILKFKDAYGIEIRVPELQRALEWNQSRGFIDYRHNADTEVDEWYLTERGRAKEGLA